MLRLMTSRLLLASTPVTECGYRNSASAEPNASVMYWSWFGPASSRPQAINGSSPSPDLSQPASLIALPLVTVPGRAQMVGLDLSAAQLARARRNAPHASFVQGNMAEATFAPASYDLVTNFWGGYCYLGSRARIASLWRSAIDWIAPGGALYVEVLLGEDLASFNRSQFAQQTGFAVIPRSDDYSEWAYQDIGGTHVMTSPPLQQFLDIVSPAFQAVETKHDGMFMVHLVATGRL